jgi:hypothetical protein
VIVHIEGILYGKFYTHLYSQALTNYKWSVSMCTERESLVEIIVWVQVFSRFVRSVRKV